MSKWNDEDKDRLRRVMVDNLGEFNRIAESIDVSDKYTIHAAVSNLLYVVKIGG